MKTLDEHTNELTKVLFLSGDQRDRLMLELKEVRKEALEDARRVCDIQSVVGGNINIAVRICCAKIRCLMNSLT